MSQPESLVLYRVDDHVATITLNRPDRLNTITPELARELLAVMDRFEREEDAWVGTLTGAGERAFYADMDLKSFAAGHGSAIIEGWDGFQPHPYNTEPVIPRT